MAFKPATPQQLAYLDELKERLQEIRKRQNVFMSETAQILRRISSDLSDTIEVSSRVPSLESLPRADDRLVAEPEAVVAEQVSERECAGNIKQLIQRFEDLRQTSSKFSKQPMPEELMAVDVRKLLMGYEKLIVDGNMLQKSWLLLKETTESCARQSHRDDPQSDTPSSKMPSSPDRTSDCPRTGPARASPKSHTEATAPQVFPDLADGVKYKYGKPRTRSTFPIVPAN